MPARRMLNEVAQFGMSASARRECEEGGCSLDFSQNGFAEHERAGIESIAGVPASVILLPAAGIQIALAEGLLLVVPGH